MKKVLFICIIVYLYTGCSKFQHINTDDNVRDEELSCSIKAKPKSLQFLEQQYRCTSKK